MTNEPPRRRSAPPPRARVLAFVLVALLLAPFGTTLAEDEDLPADWVAVANGRILTRRNLAVAVFWRIRHELQEAGSAPLTIFRRLIERVAIEQEGRRRGVTVQEAEVTAKYRQLDTQVRDSTNGQRTLADVIVRDQESTVAIFRDQLRYQLLRERVAGHPAYMGATLPRDERRRIAQTEVVIAEILKKVDVRYGVPTALGPVTPMDPQWVATVNSEPILIQTFGEELLKHLSNGRIKRILEDECKSVLTEAYALTVEEMDRVIQEERKRWLHTRELSTQDVMSSVSYEDYMRMKYGLDLEIIKADRFFRGIYGLVEKLRADVTEEEVRQEFEKKKDSHYGDSILILDVQIGFSSAASVLVPGGDRMRDRRAALNMAHDVLRRHHLGIPFDQIASEINAEREATYRVMKLRIRNTLDESILYEKAKALGDGDVSSPFETLSEVHVIQRIREVPAPAFEDVRDVIREGMAKQEAHAWLEGLMEDETKVQIRWPLPAGR